MAALDDILIMSPPTRPYGYDFMWEYYDEKYLNNYLDLLEQIRLCADFRVLGSTEYHEELTESFWLF
jgi:hypothetical protein